MSDRQRRSRARLGAAIAALTLCMPCAWSAVTAQYLRLDDPTGFAMEVRQIEVFSGGVNVVLHHPEMVSGTAPPAGDASPPARDGIVVVGGRGGKDITGGDTDTSHRATEWRAWANPVDNALDLNPWLEIDLGKPMAIDKVVVYASRYPSRFYLDKGHRTVALLDAKRTVAWAAKWQYYDKVAYPAGVFAFVPMAEAASPVTGLRIPERAHDWVPMSWLLDADASRPPADAGRRMAAFAARNAPAQVERLARQFFPMLDERLPELEPAFRLYAAGRFQQALDAWKAYWFDKMGRANLHTALHQDFVSYGSHGDDLMAGIMVTITPGEARAIRYQPGQINWIDLPAEEGKAMNAALEDCERKAQVGKVSWPLLYAFRRKPEPGYVARWAEIMDDWSMNFFVDAAASRYEVENLFTFNPGHAWGTLMEDLSDIARERPELIALIPSTTLARVQLLCLEKYSTAWWRQARETVFNHNTGGIYSWGLIVPYLGEFHAGQRAAVEQRQAFERFITLGTERDGSMTEIGDEGHMEMPVILGYILAMQERTRPAWYTPGWRNAALEWYDGMFAYMFRHLSPGGYEHRFAIGYRPQRWTSTCQQYLKDRLVFRPLDRDAVFFAKPEVRRLLDAWGHISAGGPASGDPLLKPVIETQRRAHDQVLALLGDERPGAPHVLSDWMPYTGSYYFRDGWQDEAPFLAMMACGSHGGSQAPQWPYGMWYHYDFRYPLVAAQPVQVDGLPPQQLSGRMNCFQPGTKTMALTNADERPAPNRWLSGRRFDFGEAEFHGGYQRFPGFKGQGADEHLDLGPAVADVRSVRRIIQLHGRHLFIVADAIAADDHAPHEFSVPYKFSLSMRAKGATRPFTAEQLLVDERAARLRSDNPDGPSVTVHHFSDLPVRYQRGAEAKPGAYYAPRLGPDIAIADQPATVAAKGSAWTLVSVLAARDLAAPESIASIEASAGGVGFHATLRDGAEVWYRSAGLGAAPLACGPVTATAQALLVVKDQQGISGLVQGGARFAVAGTAQAGVAADAEFTISAGGAVTSTPILAPIDPVAFRPGRNAFVDSESVEMVSATPGVEIRYTTDGTPPTRASTLYAAPVRIVESTEFAARAFRLGMDGKPLPADDFEINGTRFTVPSYGWFAKRPYRPALAVAETGLAPGLDYDLVTAPWWRLYAGLHWLDAAPGGSVEREMDLSRIAEPDSHGVRFHGYLRIPADGVYTFHAPHELVYMDAATSYDLRVWVDGEEWSLTQWWHGHGTWSVPLKQGLHAFQVDFADARTKPWRRSGIWRYYPKPWAVYQGDPTPLLISGPGLQPGRIPKDWLVRQAR